MLRIEVLTYNGQPPPIALAAEFGEAGGKIGRGEGNELILPDPGRLISRIHATILFRSGSYVIRDLGSGMPVYVNGRALGTGIESVLGAGDEIRIGGYSMRVSGDIPGARSNAAVGAGSSLGQFGRPGSDNPFADLITPAPPPERAAPAVPLPSTPTASRASEQRVAASKVIDDPFSVPEKAQTPGKQTPSDLIPDDFDPFALPAPAPTSSKLPDDFDAGLVSFTEKRSIDEIYDLNASAGAASQGLPLEPVLGALPVDPLEAIGAVRPKPSAAPTQRDDAPEIYANFQIPAARPDPNMLPPVQPTQVAPSVIQSGPREVAKPLESGASAAVGASVRAVPEAPPPRTALPVEPVSNASAADAATLENLLRQFLAGAGVPDLDMPAGLTPQLMNMFGRLLHEAMQGTLDLLRARALLKHEMRAAMTMLAERENNPLKFSPNVEVAMRTLLAPPGPGYMTPLRAMRDAYDDLRAHEIGFMAGMRAALAGVLARFDPEPLEKRLTQDFIDNLLPSSRKAKCWDQFTALYQQLSKEAEDDFHTLFGREFLRAYAAQIAKLEEESERSP